MIYISFALTLIGILLLLLPSFGAITDKGELVALDSFSVLFGGSYVVNFPSGTYSFHFKPNVALIIMLQCFLLSAVGCLFGKNAPLQIGIGVLLMIGGLILAFLSRSIISWVNEGISPEGIAYSPLGYIALSCFILSLIIMVIKFIESLIYWQNKRAVV